MIKLHSKNNKSPAPLPSEKIVWKLAATGFGLICGIAVIVFMNMVNNLFYPLPGENAEGPAGADPVWLAGRWIAIATGSFFAGGLTCALNPNVGIRFITALGILMMIPGITDLMFANDPLWYGFVSLFLYIPCTLLGYYFLKRYSLNQKTREVHDSSDQRRKKSENR